MSWLAVHIETSHAGLESVEAFLSSLGIDDVVIDDEEEFREFLQENTRLWDYVDEQLERSMAGRSRLTFYLEADDAGFSKLAEVRVALQAFRESHSGCGSLLMTLDNLEESDWAENWKQYYRPMEIGERLLVVPAWEKPSSGASGDRLPLILEPGLTFGTGSHATTRLCLMALESVIHGGERVLDLGCGSGILAIASVILGASKAVAVDIDPACETVVRENAALNGIGSDRLQVLIGDVLTDDALTARLGNGYDVILANIVADVIIPLAPAARPLLAPGGRFLCSGIIDERSDEVADALHRAGWSIESSRSAEGWTAFICF